MCKQYMYQPMLSPLSKCVHVGVGPQFVLIHKTCCHKCSVLRLADIYVLHLTHPKHIYTLNPQTNTNITCMPSTEIL